MARTALKDPGRLRLLKERPRDGEAIEEMTAAAFGPDRLHKTVYRLREDVPPIKDLCFICLDRKGRLRLKAGGRIKKLLTIFSTCSGSR